MLSAAKVVESLQDGNAFSTLLRDLEGRGGGAVAAVLRRAAQLVATNDLSAELCRDACWEKLHTGNWDEVSVVWRDAYTAASLLCAARHVEGAAASPTAAPLQADGRSAVAAASEALRQLDMAALLGGPAFRPLLDACIAALERSLGAHADANSAAAVCSDADGQPQPKRRRVGGGRGAKPDEPQSPMPMPPGALQSDAVPRRELPSLESFLEEFMGAPDGGRPVVITGGIEHWPARQKWGDMAYLRTAAGARTVPVEVGQHYLAVGWGQQLMTLSDFIDRHILSPSGSCDSSTGVGGGGGASAGAATNARGYLAQHELFEQIPALRADICEPEYCALGSGGHSPTVNAWFGPPGTVTPAHTDPYHNLLTQVVGRKYVRLYSPAAMPALYPFQEGFTTNCSQVDVDAPDVKRFPRFAGTPHADCVLQPGDMLYIPPGWWHYVKALSVSFSVSFWWQ